MKNVGRFTCVFVIFSTVSYAATHSAGLKVGVGTFLYWIQGLGAWGLVALFIAYVGFVMMMLPTTLLNLGAGYCFGVLLGFPVIWLASVIGATIAFLLGRTMARECVMSYLYGYSAHLRRVDQGLLQGKDAFRFVFLSRVPPCMPFPILNYLYGTTGVPLSTYVSGTALGVGPGTFLYVYIGHALHSLVDLLSGDPQALGLHYQVLFVVSVGLTVVVTLFLANEARLVGQLPIASDERQLPIIPNATHTTTTDCNMQDTPTMADSPEQGGSRDHTILMCEESSCEGRCEGSAQLNEETEETFLGWLSSLSIKSYVASVTAWSPLASLGSWWNNTDNGAASTRARVARDL